MPNPNNFECKACGATFDSKDQLDNHNRREHPSMTNQGTEAGKSGGTGSRQGEQKQGEQNKWGSGGSQTGREAGTGSGTGGSGKSGEKNY